MASAYPGGLDSFAINKADGTATPTDHPTHHNDLADAVNKIEAELGTDPSGAAATVAAALAAVVPGVQDPALTFGVNAADVNWDGNDVAAGTTLTVTGSQTITEGTGLLSVLYTGQSANDFNALVFAKTVSIGDKWRVPTRLLTSTTSAFSMIGLVLADGVTGASVISGSVYYNQTGADNLDSAEGSFGTVTLPQTLPFNLAEKGFGPWLWIEVEYLASNSFQTRVSLDGLSFLDWGSAEATTLTPTHVALIWSKWGTAGTSIATFGPLTKH